MWSSAAHWLETLTAAITTPEGEELRAAAKVSIDTLLDVAAADARAADSRTGRGVTTAHETVAKALGCSAKTVQRARSLLEALGFAVTVVGGRYLTTEERAAATAHHGGDQRRMASERALLVPRSLTNVHLPRRGKFSSTLTSRSGLPTRADARGEAAPRPAPKRKAARSFLPRPPVAVQRLAAGLAQRLPWLARGHIGSLCHTLTRLGLDDVGWTAHDVIDMLDRRNLDLGLFEPSPSSQRDPLALFAHQVRAALVDVDEPPRLRRARDAAARADERARVLAARAAEDARLAAERADPEVQARIAAAKRKMREHLAAARAHARHQR
ncbi:MAG: replication protein [Tessaracoccus sp.]